MVSIPHADVFHAAWFGFSKDLVAVGIRANLFAYEKRDTLEGELGDSYLSTFRLVYFRELCQASAI